MTTQMERLALVMQWLGKNPNVAHYFAVKIPNVFAEIERAINVDSLYNSFVRYASRFLPKTYIEYIIGQLRDWLIMNGSY